MVLSEEPTAYAMLEHDGHIGDLRVDQFDLETISGYIPETTPGTVVPLYTANQLTDKMNMTQTQYSSLNRFINDNTEQHDDSSYDMHSFSSAYIRYTELSEEEQDTKYPKLFELLHDIRKGQGNRNGDQAFSDIARIWANINNANELKEWVNITPSKAWFVRSKTPDKDGYYAWLDGDIDLLAPDYAISIEPNNEYSMFESEKDASMWSNPLMGPALLEYDE